MRRRAPLLLGSIACAFACAPGDLPLPEPRAARTSRPIRPVELPAGPLAQPELIVKFVDAAEVRATNLDALVSLRDVDLAVIEDARDRFGLRFTPVFSPKVEGLLERARVRSGRPQPDLMGMMKVDVPAATPEALVEIGRALQASPVVELAYVHDTRVPPPYDLFPATPDHRTEQAYAGAAAGIDAEGVPELDGSGIRIADVEYAWKLDHEEWIDFGLQLEAGVTVWPGHEDDHHGTAVAGMLIAGDNGYGIIGLTPGARLAVYPEVIGADGLWRRADAIASAIADSAEGDVVLLEMQTAEPSSGEYGPAELEEAVWMITRVGVDAGVVIVAAAGNGNVDLDAPELTDYRERGDSGAILVGAGEPGTRDTLYFSTHGSRVNVQGWGLGVFTTGYGEHAMYGYDPRQAYTATFAGTSSASPIVAGAAALVQQAAREAGNVLSSEQMRLVLETTGLPQGSGGHIGPLPQVPLAVAAAIDDGTAPRLEFVTPQDDIATEDFELETSIVVEAIDDSGVVVEVELAIDGELQPAVATTPPFTFDAVTFPVGTWEVVAYGRDVWGNVGESAPLRISVGVDAAADSTGEDAENSDGADEEEASDGDGGNQADDDGGPYFPTALPRPASGCRVAPGRAWLLLLLAPCWARRRRLRPTRTSRCVRRSSAARVDCVRLVRASG